jgi:hypothetical protein
MQREEEGGLYDAKFEEIRPYFQRIVHSNPDSYYDITTDDCDVFQSAFLLFGPAMQMIRKLGRPISGTDWGHSKHVKFNGIYAFGTFQYGSGHTQLLWMAVHSGKIVWQLELQTCAWMTLDLHRTCPNTQ